MLSVRFRRARRAINAQRRKGDCTSTNLRLRTYANEGKPQNKNQQPPKTPPQKYYDDEYYHVSHSEPEEPKNPKVRALAAKWNDLITKLDEMDKDIPIPAPLHTSHSYPVGTISVPNRNELYTPKIYFEDPYLNSAFTRFHQHKQFEVVETMNYSERAPSYMFPTWKIVEKGIVQMGEDNREFEDENEPETEYELQPPRFKKEYAKVPEDDVDFPAVDDRRRRRARQRWGTLPGEDVGAGPDPVPKMVSHEDDPDYEKKRLFAFEGNHEIRSMADLEAFMQSYMYKLAKQLGYWNETKRDKEIIDKSGVAADYQDYLISEKAVIPRVKSSPRAKYPQPLKKGQVYWSTDLSTIEIDWMKQLHERINEVDSEAWKSNQSRNSDDSYESWNVPGKAKHSDAVPMKHTTDVMSTLARKENQDPTLYTENVSDNVIDVATMTSTYFNEPDVGDSGLYEIMKFTGPPPKSKALLSKYKMAEKLYGFMMTSRTLGRAVYDLPTIEEDMFNNRLRSHTDPYIESILTAGAPMVSKRFDFKRISLILKYLNGDTELDAGIRWMSGFYGRTGEHLYTPPKQTAYIDPSSIKEHVPEMGELSAYQKEQLEYQNAMEDMGHNGYRLARKLTAKQWRNEAGNSAMRAVLDERVKSVGKVGVKEVDLEDVGWREMEKLSASAVTKVKEGLHREKLGLVIRGIPKGTSVEDFYRAFSPLIFQNMIFNYSPNKEKYEVVLENVTVSQALVFSKKLSNASINGSKLELLPVFSEQFPRNAINVVCEKMGVTYNDATNKSLTASLQQHNEISNQPKEFSFFVRAPSKDYKPSYNQIVMSDKEFKRRVALLTNDWEAPLLQQNQQQEEGNPVIYDSSAGYWHLSWPRKYPGHKWKRLYKTGDNEEERMEGEEDEEIVLQPNWNWVEVEELKKHSSVSIMQRILAMDKLGSVVNLFGGPEVSVFRRLNVMAVNAFTIGIEHPPLELFYLSPPSPTAPLSRGGLRNIPLPKNFPSEKDMEKFFDRNFKVTSSFPMERQRWARSIQMSISDYFGIELNRVIVVVKPEGKDDELVNTKSIVFVRIRDINGEFYAHHDTYEPGYASHLPYKSRRKPLYEIFDDTSYKQFPEEEQEGGEKEGEKKMRKKSGSAYVGENIMQDDNEITRSFDDIVDVVDDDDVEFQKYARQHANLIERLSKQPPMYNKKVINKKTGAQTTSLVIIPDATFYHEATETGRAVTPQDVETWKLLVGHMKNKEQKKEENKQL